MKAHLVELLAQFAATFFTIVGWVVTDFLQDFYNILARFALIFIYGHWFLYFQTIIGYIIHRSGEVVGKTSAGTRHHIMRTTFARLFRLCFKYMAEKSGMHLGN